jgi:hypothetical protein
LGSTFMSGPGRGAPLLESSRVRFLDDKMIELRVRFLDDLTGPLSPSSSRRGEMLLRLAHPAPKPVERKIKDAV